MTLPAAIFREYDIRGTVATKLTPEVARAIGQAVATLAWSAWGARPGSPWDGTTAPPDRRSRTVSSPHRSRRRHGVDVGELPTPALYFATHVLQRGRRRPGDRLAQSARVQRLQVRARWRGGCRPDIQGLRRLIEEGRTPGRPGGGRSEDGSVLPRYRDAIVQRNGPLPRKVKAVVDAAMESRSVIAVDTLQRLGAEVVPLFCQSDGTFPNHHPDPTVVENLRDLQAAVRRDKQSWGSPSTATAIASARWTSRVAPCSAISCWCCSAATWRAAWVRARR